MPNVLLHHSLSMGSASWYNQTTHCCFPLDSVWLLLGYCKKTWLMIPRVYYGIIERKTVHVKSHGNAGDRPAYILWGVSAARARKERNVASGCSGWALRHASTSWKSSSIRLMVAASNRSVL